jgi:3D (Asp-Asp-Asp) domain-containing protein
MILDKKILILAKKVLFVLSFSFVFIQSAPQLAIASPELNFDYARGPVVTAINNHPDNPITVNTEKQTPITSALPSSEELPYYETYITTTAYTSREQETDSDPFIAAWGDHVFWGMVASNAYPKGTKIQIPEYFGDKMFTVLDKMNTRYYHRIDVWMPELDDAKHFYHYTKIRVYK